MSEFFGTTQGGTSLVNTSPFQVSQRPDMRAANALQSVSQLINTGIQAYGAFKKENDQEDYITASQSINAVDQWYMEEKVKASSPEQLKELHSQYSSAINSVADGMATDYDRQKIIDGKSNFINTENASVLKAFRDRDITNLTNDLVTTVTALKDVDNNGLIDIANDFKAKFAPYIDPEDKTFNTKIITTMGNALIYSRFSNTKDLNQLASVKEALLELNNKFDGGKSAGKKEFADMITKIDSFKATQTQAQKDIVNTLKNSTEFKSYRLNPEEVSNVVSTNNGDKTVIGDYARKFNKVVEYTKSGNYNLNLLVDDEQKEAATSFVKSNVKELLSNNNFKEAAKLSRESQELSVIKSYVATTFNNIGIKDPNEVMSRLMPMFDEYRANKSFIHSMAGENADAFLYLNYLQENNEPINEGTFKLIEEKKDIPLGDVKVPKNVLDKIPKDRDYLANLNSLQKLIKFTGNADEAYSMWKDNKDAYETSNVRLHDYPGGKGARTDGYLDDISDIFIEGIKEMFPEGDDFKLEYNADTNTFFANVDGIPMTNLHITMEDMEYNYKLIQEEAQKTPAANSRRNATNNFKKWWANNLSWDATKKDIESVGESIGKFKDFVLSPFFINGKAEGGDYLETNSLAPKRPEGVYFNPGNVEKGDNWEGQEESQGYGKNNRFAVFKTPEAGVRALAITLNTKMSRGLTTIKDIISEYAPNTENDTQNYINFVANGLGIKETDKVSPKDIGKIVPLIIQMENKKEIINKYYTPEVINRGLNMAETARGAKFK